MRRGKLIRTEGIYVPSGEMMKGIEPDSGDKYLRIPESVGIRHSDMKEKTKKGYL